MSLFFQILIFIVANVFFIVFYRGFMLVIAPNTDGKNGKRGYKKPISINKALSTLSKFLTLNPAIKNIVTTQVATDYADFHGLETRILTNSTNYTNYDT